MKMRKIVDVHDTCHMPDVAQLNVSLLVADNSHSLLLGLKCSGDDVLVQLVMNRMSDLFKENLAAVPDEEGSFRSSPGYILVFSRLL